MNDRLLALSLSVYTNPGVYALLLGSGVSRSAGIPTGWEIVSDLCRHLAGLNGESTVADPLTWYVDEFGKEPRYDDLIEALAKTPEERRNLLNRYFVPTEEEREQGLKVPTAAHRAIARLVKHGLVKVIVTTNFDRLMELALESEGVTDFSVIYTEDSIQGAKPLVHSACTVLKLHGDYRDSRLRNTSGELAQYSPRMEALLDRILDEYGLIVAGWSATWDEALRAAMLRSPGRRYSWYWLARGEVTIEASDLIKHREASVIRIADADHVLNHVEQSISSLQKLESQHPASVQIAVQTAKRFLSADRYRIDLHDLVVTETVDVQQKTEGFAMEVTGDTLSEVHGRVRTYLARTEQLRGILATVGFFGRTSATSTLVTKTIERLGQVPATGGLTALLQLRLLPMYLAAYTVGVAATAADDYTTLHAVLLAPRVSAEHGGRAVPAVMIMKPMRIFIDKQLVPIDNAKNHHTPVSDYLFAALRPSVDHFLPTENEYTRAFHRFEYLVALAYMALEPEEQWAPLGRIAWNSAWRQDEADLVLAVQAHRGHPLVTDMFGGDADCCLAAMERLTEFLNRVRRSL